MSESTANMGVKQCDPDLGPPGAGVPGWQMGLGGILVRVLSSARGPEKCAAWAGDLGRDLLSIAGGIGQDRAQKRVLIRPMGWLEDSSRHWSAAMVLEHLVIVGNGVAGVIATLSSGKSLERIPGTADVKPTGAMSIGEAVDAFAMMDEAYRRAVQGALGSESRMTAVHPWFGPLNARQWCCFEPVHRQVHLRQMKRIVSGVHG